MALVHADSFVYNNISSESFNLMIAYSEPQEQITTGLSLSISQGDTNKERSIPNFYGATYNASALTFSFQIYHKDASPFTDEESAAINRWLSQTEYKPLYFNDKMFGSKYVYYAIFTEITDMVYNGISGKQLTFVCNSSFAYTRPKKLKYSIDSQSTFDIINQSDDGIYYPVIDIQTNTGVRITNETDGKYLLISKPFNGTIDNEKMMIFDNDHKILPLSRLGWTLNQSSPTLFYWLRLLQGKNTITISGKCDITFTMSFPRKVGLV